MSCLCNTTGLADEIGRNAIKTIYKMDTFKVSFMDKVVTNPMVLGMGFAAGSVLTFVGMKLLNRR